MNQWKASTQLVARCTYNPTTGRVVLEDYTSYYLTLPKKKLFKQ